MTHKLSPEYLAALKIEAQATSFIMVPSDELLAILARLAELEADRGKFYGSLRVANN